MKGMKEIRRFFLLVLLCVSMAAGSFGVTAEAAKTISNSESGTGLNYESLVLLTGQKQKLSLTGVSGKTVWSSKDSSVVSVTQKGVVTALKKGKTTITVKTSSAQYVCKITVQAPKLSCTSKTLTEDSKIKLKLKGTDQKITWKSSNKKVATVSSKGVVTACSAGKCKIYAIVLGKKFKCSITVKASGTQNSGSSSAASSDTQTEEGYVWVSATGSKYHKTSGCGNMNASKARKITLEEAKKKYSPCSKCY